MYKYNEDKLFARCSKYPLCYRTVICHALFKQDRTDDKCDVKKIFQEFYAAYKEGKIFKKPGFIELYKISMREDTAQEDTQKSHGYLLIDKTKGCFPLVFYDSKTNPQSDVSERTAALERVMDDLNNNIDGIIGEFSAYKEKKWDYALQEKLHEGDFFHEKDKRMA